MDVDRLGQSLVEQLVRHGLVTDLADVFALPDKREQLLALERMGDKSVQSLLDAVQNAKTSRRFDQLLTALGIPLVGSVAARLVAEKYGDLSNLLAQDTEQLKAELESIDGIGTKMAESVASYFGDPDQRAMLEKMLALGVVAKQPVKAARVEG